jgi:hypothetical protein
MCLALLRHLPSVAAVTHSYIIYQSPYICMCGLNLNYVTSPAGTHEAMPQGMNSSKAAVPQLVPCLHPWANEMPRGQLCYFDRPAGGQT